MFLKQAVRVMILGGLTAIASTFALSKPAQAECYFFDLICIGDNNANDGDALPEGATLPNRDRRASRRVPPIGTTRPRHLTDPPERTRIHVTTHAHLDWVDTGLELSAGEYLSMEATGTWSAGGENPIETTANGYPDAYSTQALDSTLPFASLIGRIENGAPFLIGEGKHDTVMTGGRLFLSMNDVVGGFDDNSGGIWVEIIIDKPL